MISIRAFIAGIALPSTLLPLGLYLLMGLGRTEVLAAPAIHFIPFLWGIWNVLYFAFLRRFLPDNLDLRLFLTGAILGFFVAIFGVFWLKLPAILAFPENVYYAPLLILPVLYGILWRFIVKPINDLVGLTDA